MCFRLIITYILKNIGILLKMKSATLLGAFAIHALAVVTPKWTDQTEYEYVVVGSGAGGASVA